MQIIGLTGPVASGKNFVAGVFKKLKIPVFDADFEVHQLFCEDKNIFDQIKSSFPKAIVNEKIDRKLLGKEVFKNKIKLDELEDIIYPSLRLREDSFLNKNRRNGKKIVVLNIPLLFEKGGFKRCSQTITIITPKKIRFNRFLQRSKGLSLFDARKKFESINKNQMNERERKKYADYCLFNGLDKGFSARQVKKLMKKICNINCQFYKGITNN
ncbi:MAG: dephospho-CoA kinase [Lentimonas sp.]|jgi:dephospho-CoA kinase